MLNVKPAETQPQLQRLLDVMAALRDPDTGCPWDVKQTMTSLIPYTIEEAYEVADAIERGTMADVREELGDLLFQVVFYAQIASENGQFAFGDVCDVMSEKLIRRHPHVFGNAAGLVMSEDELATQWDAIKQTEKPQKAENGFFEHIPSGLPALKYAYKLQKACAKVGFDWPDITPVLEKVREEVEEISQELNASSPDQSAVEEEIGDALFAMVNLARHAGVDADSALRKASIKFARRFDAVCERADEPLSNLSLEEMEALWQQVKKQK